LICSITFFPPTFSGSSRLHAPRSPIFNPSENQPSLFGDLPPLPPPRPPRASQHTALASQLPTNLRLGTSSWSFPGWQGLVYPKLAKPLNATTLSRDGLATYASSPLLQTVGLDRTFYQPIAISEFAHYASQVPSTFRFLVKAHGQLFRPPGLGRVGDGFESAPPTRDLYLDSAWMLDAVIAPAVGGLARKDACTNLGVILMQLPPLPLRKRGPAGTPEEFTSALIAFMQRVRQGAPTVPLALEVRNAELLTPSLAHALLSLRIAPALVHHPSMPRIPKQVEAFALALHQPAIPWICRWMLHHSQSYEGAKGIYEPFDRVIDDDAPTRADIAQLACSALRTGAEGIIIINNKAEGCAPLSVELLAEQFARLFSKEEEN
jgi:uncharacterized protein YecE (DUF72 family)